MLGKVVDCCVETEGTVLGTFQGFKFDSIPVATLLLEGWRGLKTDSALSGVIAREAGLVCSLVDDQENEGRSDVCNCELGARGFPSTNRSKSSSLADEGSGLLRPFADGEPSGWLD